MFEKYPSSIASGHISHETEAHSLTAWAFVHEYCIESGFVFSFVILIAGVMNGQITIQTYHKQFTYWKYREPFLRSCMR
jgi:hypothetical protein